MTTTTKPKKNHHPDLDPSGVGQALIMSIARRVASEISADLEAAAEAGGEEVDVCTLAECVLDADRVRRELQSKGMTMTATAHRLLDEGLGMALVLDALGAPPSVVSSFRNAALQRIQKRAAQQ